MKSFSHVQLFVTPWTVAYQAPPFTGFSRQAYWSGLPFPSPGDLPDPGIEPRSPALRAGTFNAWASREVPPIILREELRNRRGDQMHSLLINTPVHSTYNIHIIADLSSCGLDCQKGVNTIYKGLCFLFAVHIGKYFSSRTFPVQKQHIIFRVGRIKKMESASSFEEYSPSCQE